MSGCEDWIKGQGWRLGWGWERITQGWEFTIRWTKFGGGKEPRYHPRAKSRDEKDQKRMDNRLMKGWNQMMTHVTNRGKRRRIRGGLEPLCNPTLQRCDEKEQHRKNGNKQMITYKIKLSMITFQYWHWSMWDQVGMEILSYGLHVQWMIY